MSDSEDDTFEVNNFKEIQDEIERCKRNPETSGMFVSGWDDADQDVDVVKNPKGCNTLKLLQGTNKNLPKKCTNESHPSVKPNPIDHVLWAAENGDVETLKELLTNQPGLVHTRDSDGYTPLHRAAYGNHTSAISLLLSLGANIHTKTELGWTPLHSACNWNHYGAAARLLAAGADPKAVSDGEQTPMHLAAAISHCKSTLLVLLLREDVVEVADKPNNSGESPKQLALGNGIYGPIFEMVLPAASFICSLAFTCNPYFRAKVAK